MKPLLKLITCLILSTPAFTQYGTLDTSFADEGIMIDTRIYGINDNDMAYQPDGKIILGGGGFTLARYNANGNPDSSFGNNGITNYIANTNCRAIYLQEDGKIIAAGDTTLRGNPYGSSIFIVRYNTDGSIDSNFGNNGRIFTKLERYNNPEKVIIRSDAKIIVSGKSSNDPGEEPDRIFVICYNADGSLDESFATNGVFSLYNEYGLYEVKGLAINEQGEIYIGFSVSVGKLDYNILKLHANGSRDESYGLEGLASHTFSEFSGGDMNGMILLADSKILTVGTTGEVMLCRFTETGQVDETFGTKGYTLLNLPNNNSEGNSLVINDNKIIVAGRVTALFPSFDYNLALFGFDINGHIDSSFGSNGYEVTIFNQRRGVYHNIAIASDGNIIASGSSYSLETNATNFIIVKYIGSNDYVKNPKYVKIKKWLHRHGFTWEDWPGKNISYYSIQRSNNGNTFNEIARLFNRNNQQQYSYEDAAPIAGSNYYRLAAISADGSTAYSNIIAIENTVSAIKIYPNPAKNNLQVEGLTATQKTKLTITDFNGNTRMNTTVTGSSYNWNVSQLKQGNYILKIESNNKVATKKFVKE